MSLKEYLILLTVDCELFTAEDKVNLILAFEKRYGERK